MPGFIYGVMDTYRLVEISRTGVVTTLASILDPDTTWDDVVVAPASHPLGQDATFYLLTGNNNSEGTFFGITSLTPP